MKRLKVLMSAYGCEPGKGSEPGVGWNTARSMAQHHDVWVITRANNRGVIEEELERRPVPHLHVAYYDLPAWARWWKRGARGVQLYYYLWQLGLYRKARQLHREIGFDLAHHVTFVRYWTPSLLARLGVPFIWGPVGGAESAPNAFRGDFSLRGRAYEYARDAMRWLGERDPLTRQTARRSALALATTAETAARLRAVGAPEVRVLEQVALREEELSELGNLPSHNAEDACCFVSVGYLLHWKGFYLGLRAFACAALPAGAEYRLIGDGPERERLQALAEALGVADRVRFLGWRPREEALHEMARCHVLVHPSLHDSGGFVCAEAMAAGLPVLCLDLGGPARQVTSETGVKVPARTPSQAVRDLSRAMQTLAENPERRVRMGAAGKQRVRERFSWGRHAEQLAHAYNAAISAAPDAGPELAVHV